MPEDPAPAPPDAHTDAPRDVSDVSDVGDVGDVSDVGHEGNRRDPRDEDLVPRPSKIRYVAMLFAGILVGRLASSSFTPGALDALDLVMVIGLAFSIAWAWRTWARRAMIQRHLDAERRRQRTAARPTAPAANAPRPRPRRRKR